MVYMGCTMHRLELLLLTLRHVQLVGRCCMDDHVAACHSLVKCPWCQQVCLEQLQPVCALHLVQVGCACRGGGVAGCAMHCVACCQQPLDDVPAGANVVDKCGYVEVSEVA